MENCHNDSMEGGIPATAGVKLSSAEEALSAVKSGDKVFVGTACATPRLLIRALECMEKRLDDVTMIHFLTDGAIAIMGDRPKTRFRHKVFFVGTDTREAVKQGLAQYVPISIAQVPDLIRDGMIPIDVALIQVSLPDEHGFVSLGVSVDVTRAAVLRAKTVIAELNPHMPFTRGDSTVSVDRISRFVAVDSPVIEYLHTPADEVAGQIARYVARIISDSSTLHVGLGQIPNEMLKHLSNRKNLGIHSDVITEPIVDLIENGVITGESKTLHKGQVVASYCMGTSRLYERVNRNPMFSFHPMEYVCRPDVLANQSRLVSVTQAFSVDLIEIAHPAFRPWLIEEASRLGYIRKGQTIKSKGAYPEEAVQECKAKNGETIIIRPSRAIDASGLQDVFYHLRPEDVYTRFFTHLASLSVSRAEHLCNVDYEKEMAFIAAVGTTENEQVVGSACYFVDQTDNLAEVAYMIRPEWQALGVGTALQQCMTEYAASKGIRGFKADILAENKKMQRLIKKGAQVSMTRQGSQYEVIVLF